MPIQSFEFEDLMSGWRVGRIQFESFNLLVGLSGAGKTRILKALQTVCITGTRPSREALAARWTLEVETTGGTFTWSAVTEAAEQPENGHSREATGTARFLEETVHHGDHEVVSRHGPEVIFEGEKLRAKLKTTESCISLLGEEDSLAPLRNALEKVHESEISRYGQDHFLLGVEIPTDYPCRDLQALRSDRELDVMQKAYVLQEHFPSEFHRVQEAYKDIFETVLEIRVGSVAGIDNTLAETLGMPDLAAARILTCGIREQDVSHWTALPSMSSGMKRTLVHLLELSLFPDGSVILIDEYENSLGVNCLPPLTDHLMGRASSLQFILTSHHPYVISNIPTKYWRVVTRKAGKVTVQNASEISGLTSKSKQDAFTRLLSSPAFESGIS